MKTAFFPSKRATGIHSSSKRREAIWGYLFIAPFILGFFVLFAYPLVESARMSFSSVTSGGSGGYVKDFVGWSNFYNLLFVNVDFRQNLVDSFVQLFSQVPVIVIFSFVAAVLLNQKFFGRTFVRSVFFIPVILTAGIIMRIESGDLLTSNLANAGNADIPDSIQEMINVANMLTSIGISPSLVNFVIGLADGIYGIIISSGVQIIFFLSGLQSIPRSVHEAAKVEGATGWEAFWKLTFPMMQPLILVNVVYSIVDCFVRTTNPVMLMIQELRTKTVNYGLASALSWLYFLPIMLILIVVGLLISRRTFYYD